ncbi:protein of unknown function [Acidithiobacillus ferrivorans]|uniref:Uncharacterized protein n=1 Tax=Acidithiobacillus ferrivorans TaxID=160808 RepID=A0ABY1ML46_9PROT|nr:protein of unknown function [Acidithiobacillus ferrivorans]
MFFLASKESPIEYGVVPVFPALVQSVAGNFACINYSFIPAYTGQPLTLGSLIVSNQTSSPACGHTSMTL